jgi:hypothetical protein
MKEKLRDALITKNELNIKEGEYLYYKPAKAFGRIEVITDTQFIVLWNSDSGGPIERNYNFRNLHKEHLAKDLLDDCILCETEEDRLFVALKYGTR